MLEQKEEKCERGWKKQLSAMLKELGFTNNDFKGKIVIELNQGGVRSLNRTEKFE